MISTIVDRDIRSQGDFVDIESAIIVVDKDRVVLISKKYKGVLLWGIDNLVVVKAKEIIGDNKVICGWSINHWKLDGIRGIVGESYWFVHMHIVSIIVSVKVVEFVMIFCLRGISSLGLIIMMVDKVVMFKAVIKVIV